MTTPRVSLKWVEKNLRHYVYVDGTGRICGDVSKSYMTDGDWSAVCEGRPLGVYIDCESAQKAVEERYRYQIRRTA